MRKAIILLIMLLFVTGVLSAQQQQQQQTQQQQQNGDPLQQDVRNEIIKPAFVVGDLLFAVNSLNSVNIQGSEVDAFLQVKEHFKPYLEKIKDENMEIDQKINTEVPAGIANNMLIFLQRVKLQGGNAERYKRFRQAMIDASEVLKN